MAEAFTVPGTVQTLILGHCQHNERHLFITEVRMCDLRMRSRVWRYLSHMVARFVPLLRRFYMQVIFLCRKNCSSARSCISGNKIFVLIQPVGAARISGVVN